MENRKISSHPIYGVDKATPINKTHLNNVSSTQFSTLKIIERYSKNNMIHQHNTHRMF
jgi:hypothetical protein